jgi:hypothetical protein
VVIYGIVGGLSGSQVGPVVSLRVCCFTQAWHFVLFEGSNKDGEDMWTGCEKAFGA